MKSIRVCCAGRVIGLGTGSAEDVGCAYSNISTSVVEDDAAQMGEPSGVEFFEQVFRLGYLVDRIGRFFPHLVGVILPESLPTSQSEVLGKRIQDGVGKDPVDVLLIGRVGG